MTLHPKTTTDLLLAPVAAEVDRNLQSLRDKEESDLELELALALDMPAATTQKGRACQVLRAALRNVESHGWDAVITDDHTRVRLSGGSVSLELGLSRSVSSYIGKGAC